MQLLQIFNYANYQSFTHIITKPFGYITKCLVYLYHKIKVTMNTKAILSENKSLLKGLKFQMISGNNCTPYQTLNGIGTAILNEESAGNEVCISRVFTSTGLITILNPETFVTLLKSGIVTAISFKSYYNEKTEAEIVRSFGSLD